MTKLDKAVDEIKKIEVLSEKRTIIHSINPLAKFTVTVVFIAMVTSVYKYSPVSLLPFFFYNAAIFILGEIPIKESAKRMLIVLPFIIFLGVGSIIAGGDAGVCSFITILLKGILTITALYLFICTTGFLRLTKSLFRFRPLSPLAWIIMLLYRYIILLLEETSTILKAYSLRSGSNKISLKSGGSIIGLLFFRVLDKANKLYSAMRLRGFGYSLETERLRVIDFIYTAVCIVLFVIFRFWRM